MKVLANDPIKQLSIIRVSRYVTYLPHVYPKMYYKQLAVAGDFYSPDITNIPEIPYIRVSSISGFHTSFYLT